MGRITGPEVFYASDREHSLLPNHEEAPWEPLAMTFHFLGERFSLKGPRGGNKVPQKEWGSFTLVPPFSEVSTASKPVLFSVLSVTGIRNLIGPVMQREEAILLW